MHVIMNLLGLAALVQWLAGDGHLLVARVYLAVMVPVSVAVVVWTLGRSLQVGAAEREFAAWYGLPPGRELIFAEGWWHVGPAEAERGEACGRS